jgi:hypothetical protein
VNETQALKSNRKALPLRFAKRESGQMLAMVGVMMVGLFAMGAFVIDTGRIYFSYHELQASTDAAALAGAQGLPTKTTAVNNATSYSGVGGNMNSQNNLPGVAMVSGYPLPECLTTLKNEGLACDGTTTFNAIQVKQNATVPLTFGAILGTKSVTMTSTATAAARGSISVPYNIALIIDTTASMGTGGSDSCTDPTNSKTYTTSIGCALVGAKILLLNTAPCAAGLTTCPGGTANSVDMVSIFTFPNGTASTMNQDYTGSCTGPTIPSTYSFPVAGATTYGPTGTASDYQVTSFLSDFRTSDTATSLSSSSNLVAAIGQKSGCAGLQTPGGLGTYYAGALWAAQAADLQNQALTGRSGSQNAIIILSDGAANATKMAAKDDGGTAVSKTAYTYPSTINQCQQAIDAAQKITAAGTTIYSVAYGADTSGGCTTDSSGPQSGISACSTMSQLASSPSNFFTDTPSKSSSTCKSAQQPATGLSNIFQQIANDFTVARLIPDGTT